MGYYVIKFVSKGYNLQDDTTCDGKIILAGELVVNVKYTNFMQKKIKWYWGQKQQQKAIIFPTRTIIHTCLDVVIVKHFHAIPRSDFHRNQENGFTKI